VTTRFVPATGLTLQLLARNRSPPSWRSLSLRGYQELAYKFGLERPLIGEKQNMGRFQTLKKKRNRRRAAAQALWEATCDGDFETAKTAIQSAVTFIDIRKDTSTIKSMAPLHQACELGHVRIAKLLIDSVANVNIKNETGKHLCIARVKEVI